MTEKKIAPEALAYRIDLNGATRKMRVVFFRDKEMKDVAAYFVVNAPDGYDLAQQILKKYDILEGIDSHG